MMGSYRVSLDERQFARLVRGEVLKVDCGGTLARPVMVEIALQDIGFDIMQSAINGAQLTQKLTQKKPD